MILWRLSARQYANIFDGGYGLLYEGRWNSMGHAVTYCATSPALCVLEKLVHVEDPALLPELVMIQYEVPDHLGLETISPDDLPPLWHKQESWTQQRGDAWHEALSTPLLRAPSVLLPFPASPDVNVLINHRHEDARQIRAMSLQPFVLDVRLL
jgi:RES domain-containing protein